ncbi:hypothetical protein Vadar_000830 [Vaccinium darrowii]|uniref:Uncharacterized protein n=1 Tax=Vaccinium darrowii TaxID=229202 RepID=A0ACB7XEH5_9ERIC|nr:hypothetical protein Vadar_000830 [Vaccinium darrowii]
MEFTSKEFKVGNCEGQKLVDGETMPLVLQPNNNNDVESLLVVLEKNKEWFKQMIIDKSAVLLRGFNVRNAEDFNDIVETVGWENVSYVGPAPRTNVHKRIYTANEGPLVQPINFHHEMAVIKGYPKNVMFFCEVPPPEGGETPIVPSFRVAERMVEEFPEAVKEMEEKELKYTFIAPAQNTQSFTGGGWPAMLGTSDPVEAVKSSAVVRALFDSSTSGLPRFCGSEALPFCTSECLADRHRWSPEACRPLVQSSNWQRESGREKFGKGRPRQQRQWKVRQWKAVESEVMEGGAVGGELVKKKGGRERWRVGGRRRAKVLADIDIEWLSNGSAKMSVAQMPLTKVFDGRKGRKMWFNLVHYMYAKNQINSTMMDGTEIPEKVVKRCVEILEEESIQFKWEKGDVLFLDNLAIQHGRRPSLPPRKVLVAMGN